MAFWKYIRYHNFVLLFSFFLPINEKISTILIFVCLLALLTEYLFGTVKMVGHSQFLVLPTLFLLYTIAVFTLSDDYSFKWFEQRGSLIAFPLIFLGNGSLNYQKICRSFVYGCVMAYVLCLGHALFRSLSFSNNEVVFNPLLNDKRGFFEAIVYEGNYFFAEHFSVLAQTSYFGFYLTLALCIVIIYRTHFFDKKTVLFFSSVLVAGIVQTMSIAAFGGLFMASLMLSFLLIGKRKIRFVIYGFLTSIVISSYFVQPRIRLMVNDIAANGINLKPQERYGVMLRFLSWDAATDIIAEHPLLGVGPPNAQNALNEKYAVKNYIYPLKQELNAHNQFLQTMIECGLPGILVLGALFSFLVRKASRVAFYEKALIITFTALLFFNFVFESYLNRYWGLAIVCFFYCLFISINEETYRDSING